MGYFLSRDFQFRDVYIRTSNKHSRTVYCFLFTTEDEYDYSHIY
jgi:hypothetical protein